MKKRIMALALAAVAVIGMTGCGSTDTENNANTTNVDNTTIIQAQDILGLGSESRMNTPSSVGKNWRWRALPGVFTKELAAKLRHKMELYARI